MTKQCQRINHKDVVFTRLENEAVILNLRTKYYYTANETALAVWELLAKECDEDNIVKQLVATYEVDEEGCRSDVRVLMEHFANEGLVV